MRSLVALIVIGVLAPTGAVLWFMNEAARSQAEAARQSVADAHRGRMRLARDQVDAMWRARAAALDKAFDLSSAVQPVGADSAILFNAAGEVVYPAPSKRVERDPLADRADWQMAQMIESRREPPLQAAAAYERIARFDKDPAVVARAAQAQIRCLLAAKRRDLALAAIEQHFGSDRLARARDPEGRSIMADERLLALKLRPQDDPGRLKRLLITYDSMPTAQRLFLIQELRAIAPETPLVFWEDQDRLALRCAEAETPRPGDAAIERTALADVWKLTSPNRRAIALYLTPSVTSTAAREFGPSKDVHLVVSPPGSPVASDAIPAGPTMPGWQMAVSFDLAALDQAGARRRVTYLWVGYAAVATLAIAGLFAGQAFTRQMKLARLKTDLVAAVSHELKTPLASMRLLVDSLLAADRPDPTQSREYLELISVENVRLTRLIENFLTFSRIERGRQRFEFAPTAPARVVDAAMIAMRERWPGFELDVEVAPDLPRIPADEDALVTVLLNLLDNAYKYTPGEKRVALRALADRGGVAFLAQDNGIGIAPKEQKRIFRSFYQVDRRLARETGGCGLGLSIVEAIVRAHGGTVEVKSAIGEGSTFRVWLPGEAHS